MYDEPELLGYDEIVKNGEERRPLSRKTLVHQDVSSSRSSYRVSSSSSKVSTNHSSDHLTRELTNEGIVSKLDLFNLNDEKESMPTSSSSSERSSSNASSGNFSNNNKTQSSNNNSPKNNPKVEVLGNKEKWLVRENEKDDSKIIISPIISNLPFQEDLTMLPDTIATVKISNRSSNVANKMSNLRSLSASHQSERLSNVGHSFSAFGRSINGTLHDRNDLVYEKDEDKQRSKAVYASWLRQKQLEAKRKKEADFAKKLKEEREKDEKKIAAERLFESWKVEYNRKNKLKLEEVKKVREAEKEKQAAIEEKKVEAQKMFDVWKKNSAAKIKAEREEAINKLKESLIQKKKVESDKQTESQLAFEAWKKQKEISHKEVRRRNKEKMDELKQRETTNAEIKKAIAEEAFDIWVAMKEEEKEYQNTLAYRIQMFEEEAKKRFSTPWIPPSSTTAAKSPLERRIERARTANAPRQPRASKSVSNAHRSNTNSRISSASTKPTQSSLLPRQNSVKPPLLPKTNLTKAKSVSFLEKKKR